MYTKREEIEWANTWYSKADKPDVRRILIIGDSVLRQIRSSLEKFLPDIAIDFFGSSSTWDDELFYKYLDVFWEFKYDAVIIGMSSHRMLQNKLSEDSLNRENFKKDSKNLIDYVKKKCQNVMIITSTPFALLKDLNVADEENNKEVRLKNEVMIELANENNLPLFDYYNFTLSLPKIYTHVDHIHFHHDSNLYTTEEIIKTLLSLQFEDEVNNALKIGLGEIQNKKPKIKRKLPKFNFKNFLKMIFSIKQLENRIQICFFGFIKIKIKPEVE